MDRKRKVGKGVAMLKASDDAENSSATVFFVKRVAIVFGL